MTRAERVDRYREKKARRTDGGAVRYIARQQNAHRCGKERRGHGAGEAAHCSSCVLVTAHCHWCRSLESTPHVGSTLCCSLADGLASRAAS
jgi:hypothetical protein